ncbi:PC-esterase domain-containing protein 1A-like isoform X2 [Mixophyes fleayi]|uniref:PC-esterase domain-containing protein 1A-like isoform X2 n=1 Tax=Mixophyes fleayi TaxID=3061075 RepID=UPI003F4DFF25
MWIMGTFSSGDVRQLLHNKFVVVLGDSIQRTVYKDLVKLLQDDRYLTESQLKKKGEKTFANDTLVEGGELNEMHNGTSFREVRQYRTGYHLVRFYFLTRVYSTYLESVLSDFQSGLQPDVLIVNSCIWDISRYQDFQLEAYKTNVDNLFHRLTQVLSPECLILWNMTMPVGYKEGQMQELPKTNLRWDIVAGNFYSATLANFHKMDVLDMHYHFRLELHSRCRDATHWNQLAHRKYTQILLTHIAQAWGVEVPETKTAEGPMFLNNPFADMGIIPQPNIGFPYHGPWPPDAWQSHQRFTMRRAMSTRGTWTRSYGHYSPYPHRIY